MKKFLLSLAAVSTMLFTSCSNEGLPEGSNDGNVTFSVAMPSTMSTRAYADGLTATDVKCYVYDQSAGTTASPVFTETVDMNGLSGTVTFNLVSGRTYDFVFLAVAPNNSGITYTETTRSIAVDYSTMVSNNENLDAFYTTVQDFKVSGASTTSVELRRPYSQLNIGTDDIAAYKAATVKDEGVLPNVGVTVKNVYSALNLMTGEVVGDAAEVSFTAVAAPSQVAATSGTGFEFPVVHPEAEATPAKKYEYLAMNYLLVQPTKEIVDVTMTVGTDEFEYNNVPVQKNYRTNIYGSLLTDPTNFNVIIVPDFETPDYNELITKVSTTEELVEAIEEGGEILLTEDIVLNEKVAFSTDKPTTITLDGNTLTIDAEQAISGGADVTINGRDLDFGTRAVISNAALVIKNYKGIDVLDNSSLTVLGVDFSVNCTVPSNKAGSCVFVDGDNAKLTMKDCNMNLNNAQMYTICTNASVTRSNMVINLENVNVKPSVIIGCSVLLNQPITMTAKNCIFEGCNSGIILRGGNYDFEGCTFTQTLAFNAQGECITTKKDIKETFRNFLREKWDSGNNVPLAAVTMGNQGTSYQYPTVVNMKGCTLNIPEVAKVVNGDVASSLPALYVSANQGENLGVTFTYDDATVFGGACEYVTSNITVNGKAIVVE